MELIVGGTHVLTLVRGRPGRDGKHGHVVDYHHVIHALRRKPMALLNLVYRDQLFPREAYRHMFDHLCERLSDTCGLQTLVELLSLAHDRACEASSPPFAADLSPSTAGPGGAARALCAGPGEAAAGLRGARAAEAVRGAHDSCIGEAA